MEPAHRARQQRGTQHDRERLHRHREPVDDGHALGVTGVRAEGQPPDPAHGPGHDGGGAHRDDRHHDRSRRPQEHGDRRARSGARPRRGTRCPRPSTHRSARAPWRRARPRRRRAAQPPSTGPIRWTSARMLPGPDGAGAAPSSGSDVIAMTSPPPCPTRGRAGAPGREHRQSTTGARQRSRALLGRCRARRASAARRTPPLVGQPSGSADPAGRFRAWPTSPRNSWRSSRASRRWP